MRDAGWVVLKYFVILCQKCYGRGALDYQVATVVPVASRVNTYASSTGTGTGR